MPSPVTVALPTEGVDRNLVLDISGLQPTVALPTEGVDRNVKHVEGICLDSVALPTEGVDRNWSGRRKRNDEQRVALPTEGVDRNHHYEWVWQVPVGRPPHGGRG